MEPLHEAIEKLVKGDTDAEMDILRLRDEAELIFEQDVIDLNNKIYDKVNKVIAPHKRVGNNSTVEEKELQSSNFYNEIKSIYKNYTLILAKEENSCLSEILNKFKEVLCKNWLIFSIVVVIIFVAILLYHINNPHALTSSVQIIQIL
ncbi:MAG: hypothetical protein KBD37_06115 [Burkholderiales bacterium]|nr:hypothetical protein [Burkholderiales bacterium]